MKKMHLSVLTGLCIIMVSLLIGMNGTQMSVKAAKVPAKLRVQGTNLVNNKGKIIQLKGISTHGLSWFPQYVNKKSFKYMKKKWGINTVRLAMYTAEYNGYCTGDENNRKKLLKLIDDGVKYAKEAGLYVIIDWHILSDSNPMQYKKDSLSFFSQMAKKYSKEKHVIYEICNEPNGGTSWATIKSYAESVIKKIRKYDKDAVIIVGTPTWSQDVDVAAADKISDTYGNVMYALHFYAGTHGDFLRQKAQKAIDAGLPLFVSEYGLCDASGSGGVDKAEAKKWFDFLDKNKISMVAWNLSNKNETSAFIKSSCNKVSGWKNKELSASAKMIIKRYKK